MTTDSAWFVGLLCDVSLKALLLAAVAAAGLWLFRVRSTSVQHRVWLAVLVAMLLLPLLVAATPAVPLPGWAYPDLRAAAISGQVEQVEDRAAAIAADVVEPAYEAAPEMLAVDSVTSQPVAETSAIEATPTVPTPIVLSWSERAYLLAAIVYAIGLWLFASRLTYGVLLARRLVRSAKRVDLGEVHARTLGGTRVLESSGVRVPLTVGWWRPAVLLPSDWREWSDSMLAAVLAHEAAHVRRGDTWVALAAETNRALYWFHPLAWFLGRRLTTLAEAACDDAVIESLGDRTNYARHLLEVASRLGARPSRLRPQGVAMAARPKVEQRIEAILDDRRPLAKRVGWLATLVLCVAITPAVLFAAGLTAEKSGADNLPPLVEEQVPLASETGTLVLTVLDDMDRPVPEADARVRVRQDYMGSDAWDRRKTDQDGKLVVEIPQPAPHYFSVHIETPGFAPFLAAWENREGPDPVPAEYTVWLDAGRTIGGIVQNAEGEPIEGVEVSPSFQLKLREERTHQMGSGARVKTDAEGRWTYASLPAELSQVSISYRHPEYVPERKTLAVSKLAIPAGSEPSEVAVLKRGIVFGGTVKDVDGKPLAGAEVRYARGANFDSNSPETKTNEQGEFRFTGGEVGEAVVAISATGLAPAMRAIDIQDATAPMDVQLTRGSPLKVRVVGPDQKPLEGAHVAFWNWDGQGIYGGLSDCRGKTDAEGIWQWAHAPEGALEFSVSLPGYGRIAAEPLMPGAENVVVMSPQTRGRTIVESRPLKMRGRVTDAKTGKPIARFKVTPGYQREEGGRTYWLHDSQSSGRNGVYRRTFTPNDLSNERYAVLLRVEANGYAPATIEWELGDEESHAEDAALEQADEDRFRVVTPTGEPAAEAMVAICTADLGPTVKDGMLADYSPAERATADSDGRVNISPQAGMFGLMVVHDSGAAYASPGQLAQSRTITLQAWGRVEGTLRMRGKPAANEHVTLSLEESHEHGMPRLYFDYKTITDDEGKFVFEWVVPGSGQVMRNAVTQMGNMSSWTPTHVTKATFVPGETTRVDIGRAGRSVIGRFVLPADVKPGNDWRLAMLSIQTQPKDLPKRPTLPIPKVIDPERDTDAARAWWSEWQHTAEGKQYVAAMKAYGAAMRGFKPTNYSARANEDGTFEMEDMPAGDYQLSVQAFAKGTVGHGDLIATLQHSFVVGEGEASEAVDLGELKLENRPPAATPQDEKSAEPKAPIKAAVPVVPAKSSDRGEESATRTVSGRVVDNEGKPVAGARLWLPISGVRQFKEHEQENQETVSDAAGKFEFAVAEKWFAPGAWMPPWTIWCYAPGHGMAIAPVWSVLNEQSHAPVEISLPAASDTSFVIVDAAGKPVVGARVEPGNYSNGENLPEVLREIVGGTSDSEGRVAMPALPREALWFVSVTAEGLGTQIAQLRRSPDEPAERRIELCATGRVEGQLISENEEAIANRTGYLSQVGYLIRSNAGGTISGSAQFTTDSEGKFVVEHFVVGPFNLFISSETNAKLLPRVPARMEVRAGETTELKIPLEPTVKATGMVRTKDGTKGVAGAMVRVQLGRNPASRMVVTNDDGEFSLSVLPGEIRQHVMVMPEQFQHATENPAPRSESVQVPPDVTTFDLPPIELVGTVSHRGRLIDKAGNPVANVRFCGVAGNRRYGFTESKDDGSFEMWLPKEPKMETYTVFLKNDGPYVEATVVETEPLVLRIDR